MAAVEWFPKMTEVSWLGPYPVSDNSRHADPVTLAHVVELRKRINELEGYVKNFEDHCSKVHRTLVDVRQIIRQAEDPKAEVLRVIDEALKRL